MKYLLIITKDEPAWRALSDDERRAMTARYAAYGKRMVEAKIVRSGAILEPASTATTVRLRDGKPLVTDGPFAETTEQIAGFAIVELDGLDQAIEWAAGHPDAAWASVEIRPLIEATLH